MNSTPLFDELDDSQKVLVQKLAWAAHNNNKTTLFSVEPNEGKPTDYNSWLEYFSNPERLERIERQLSAGNAFSPEINFHS